MIFPRRCGGRTRCVGARLLRPENYYSSTLSRVRPSGSSGRAEDQDNPRLGGYHRAEISKPCYWKSCEHIFRDVPRSPAISLRTSKPTVRAPRRWIGLVPCGSPPFPRSAPSFARLAARRATPSPSACAAWPANSMRARLGCGGTCGLRRRDFHIIYIYIYRAQHQPRLR